MPSLRMVLRIALAQKVALGTPDHALVATALPLVDGGPRRLVHGVLGTLLRRGVAKSGPAETAGKVEQRWREAWGEETDRRRRAVKSRNARRSILPLLTTPRRKAMRQRTAASRSRQGTSAWRVPPSPSFQAMIEGRWWVQDLAASLPARLIPVAAENVLDLCAAPGGKTMQLAAAGHRVTAVDSSKSRLARLHENLERTHLNADLVHAEVEKWEPLRTFDAILLDAPCSATGTFRRHPEILYRARPDIIASSAEQQAKLLHRAAEWLKPGGSLVYSVCSLEPPEGEGAISTFIEAHPEFAIEAPKFGELPDFVAVGSAGSVRILPGLLAEQGGWTASSWRGLSAAAVNV